MAKTTAGKIIKGVFVTLGIILLIGILIVGVFTVYILTGKEQTLGLSIGSAELSAISDGVYTGEYEASRFSNRVEVTVQNHTITAITVLKPQPFMADETVAALTERVTQQQSLSVDAVTGATAHSKAFLKAVENALTRPESAGQ